MTERERAYRQGCEERAAQHKAEIDAAMARMLGDNETREYPLDCHAATQDGFQDGKLSAWRDITAEAAAGREARTREFNERMKRDRRDTRLFLAALGTVVFVAGVILYGIISISHTFSGGH